MEAIDSTTVLIALSILGGIVAVYLLGAPLLVRLMFSKPAEPGFYIIQPDEGLISDEALDYFEHAQHALGPLGFQPLFHLKFDPFTDLMDATALVLLHAANRDLVMALHAEGPVRLVQLEFSTEFENGDEVNTNNSPQLPLDAVMKPNKQIYWFPDTQDPSELYRAHTALCSAHGKSPKKNPPLGEDLVQTVKRGIREDFEHAASRGLFRWDPDDDCYTMSLRGAYSLAWPNMFPFSILYRFRRSSHDRQALLRASGR